MPPTPTPSSTSTPTPTLTPPPTASPTPTLRAPLTPIPTSPPAARLVITKSDSTPSSVTAGSAPDEALARAGEVISYTVRIQNAGNAPATNVLLTDVIDPNTTLMAGSVQSTQGTVRRGNGDGDASVEVALGNLAPSAEATVRFAVRVDEMLPEGVTRIANQATLTGDNFPVAQSDDPDTTETNDATQTPLAQVALLEAFKTSALDDRDGDGIVGAGDRLRYTIVVENQGGAAATGVRLLDTPDRNTALVAGSVATDAGAVVRGNTSGDASVTVNLGTLASGDSAIVAFDVIVNPQLRQSTRRITNQGTVRADNLADALTDDPTTASVDDPTVEQLLLEPMLSATKRDLLFADVDANGFASPGDVLLYEIQVRNDGNVTATGVAVEDVLTEGVTLVPGTVQSSGGELSASGSRIEAMLGALVPGGTATISFRVMIETPQPLGALAISNQATILSNELPPVLSDDPLQPGEADVTLTAITFEPLVSLSLRDLLLIDADRDDTVSTGDTLIFSAVLINSGNAPARSVTFFHAPDAQTTLLPSSVQTSLGTVARGNAASDASIEVAVGTLPAGARVNLSFQLVVGEINGRNVLSNQARVRFENSTTIFDLLSDDPDTPDKADDPTLTALGVVAEPAVLFLPVIER